MMHSWIVGCAVPVELIFLMQVLAVFEAPVMLGLVSMLHGYKWSRGRWYKYFHEMGFFVFAGHFLFCSCVLHSIASLWDESFTGKLTLLIMLFCVVGTLIMGLVYSIGKRFCPRILKPWDGSL